MESTSPSLQLLFPSHFPRRGADGDLGDEPQEFEDRDRGAELREDVEESRLGGSVRGSGGGGGLCKRK